MKDDEKKQRNSYELLSAGKAEKRLAEIEKAEEEKKAELKPKVLDIYNHRLPTLAKRLDKKDTRRVTVDDLREVIKENAKEADNAQLQAWVTQVEKLEQQVAEGASRSSQRGRRTLRTSTTPSTESRQYGASRSSQPRRERVPRKKTSSSRNNPNAESSKNTSLPSRDLKTESQEPKKQTRLSKKPRQRRTTSTTPANKRKDNLVSEGMKLPPYYRTTGTATKTPKTKTQKAEKPNTDKSTRKSRLWTNNFERPAIIIPPQKKSKETGETNKKQWPTENKTPQSQQKRSPAPKPKPTLQPQQKLNPVPKRKPTPQPNKKPVIVRQKTTQPNTAEAAARTPIAHLKTIAEALESKVLIPLMGSLSDYAGSSAPLNAIEADHYHRFLSSLKKIHIKLTKAQEKFQTSETQTTARHDLLKDVAGLRQSIEWVDVVLCSLISTGNCHSYLTNQSGLSEMASYVPTRSLNESSFSRVLSRRKQTLMNLLSQRYPAIADTLERLKDDCEQAKGTIIKQKISAQDHSQDTVKQALSSDTTDLYDRLCVSKEATFRRNKSRLSKESAYHTSG